MRIIIADFCSHYVCFFFWMNTTADITETILFEENHALQCYHCGEDCPGRDLYFDEKYFCCNGCLSVYRLLNNAGLCNYYELNPNAGATLRNGAREDKYMFLDSPDVKDQLIHFKEGSQSHVTFYIPVIHCSSCIYLLENFHKICEGVIRADVQFLKKEVRIVFDEEKTSLRRVVETLDEIGYEPYITLDQAIRKKKPRPGRDLIFRLGVAGFCFGNIMLFSIPEYFSDAAAREPYLESVFRYLNVLFSLPVFFYSATPFFKSAFKGLRQRHLNIDLPVAIAIGATFIRSLSDVFISNGSGFFDAMSGIVLFMLAGRVLQERTQRYLFFDRDYTDYFPIAVMVLNQDNEPGTKILTELKTDDHLLIHNSELVPADSILIKGKCLIDYSFVTGESLPVEKSPGDIIYAGGRQLGGIIELRVVKETSASRLMQMWSSELEDAHTNKAGNKNSFVHLLARNFTLIVFAITIISGFYWYVHDASKIWPSITAILIIACPCGLLLTATFTNGHVLRILSKNGLFLRNANIIERFGNIRNIVFDKTGTLTSPTSMHADFKGSELDDEEKELIASAIRPSLHSFRQPVLNYLKKMGKYEAFGFKEYTGLGIEATVRNHYYQIGTATFFNLENGRNNEGTLLYVYKNHEPLGYFLLIQGLRPGVEEMLFRLRKKIKFFLFSGDEPYQKEYFQKIFGDNMLFKLSPAEKLSQIDSLQLNGEFVAMTGDGLNDAGALKKSDIGICISDDIKRFTPAGDAILDGQKLSILDRFIRFCSSSKNTIRVCFFFSIIYNITGLYFAVQGILSPLIAAVLMPFSTLTIVVTTYIVTKYHARKQSLII
ncbi:MAG: heavy metal translocating P-type ATPase [Ginsengibacter sp.]